MPELKTAPAPWDPRMCEIDAAPSFTLCARSFTFSPVICEVVPAMLMAALTELV